MCILISLILVGLNAARAHSHDENKMSQIQTIVVGLTQFHDYCNVYPPTLDATTQYACLGNQTFASLVPDIASYQFNDSGSSYKYAALASPADPNTCIAYHIGVVLETTDSNESAKSSFVLANHPELTQCLTSGSVPDTIIGTDPLMFDLEK